LPLDDQRPISRANSGVSSGSRTIAQSIPRCCSRIHGRSDQLL
jgi:hypothetical protein